MGMSDTVESARGMGGRLREMHLFAGAGGGILGGMLLGHTPVCAVEIEPFCQAVLKQRQSDGILPEFPIFGDIKEFDGKPWRGKADVVAGGFPCQDISSAGKGAGINGERSSLFFELARVVREVGPRYVFLENSPMLVTRGLDTVLGTLADLGYDAAWGAISAADCGANHLRKRIWILAVSNSIGGQRWPADAGEEASRRSHCEAERSSPYVADGFSSRLEGYAGDGEGSDRQGWVAQKQERPTCESGLCRGGCGTEERNPQSGLGGMVDGLAPRVDCDCMDVPDWYENEPEIPRITSSSANRVHRLKALGNGQVPRVAATAWVTLEKILRGDG